MYCDPNSVVSPKSSWELKQVIYNTGQGGWSVAHGEWDGDPVIGIRWNGSDNESGCGNPQSRGHATWFIIPEDLKSTVLQKIESLTHKLVNCNIERPEGYDLGAWTIEASLGQKIIDLLNGSQLVFALPSLPNRLCRPDKGYYHANSDGLQGCFVDGKWRGHLYSNGIEEYENPTQIDAFRAVFIQNVMKILEGNFLEGTACK